MFIKLLSFTIILSILILDTGSFARDTSSRGWVPGQQTYIDEETLINREKLYNYDIQASEARYADRPAYNPRRYYYYPYPSRYCSSRSCKPYSYYRCNRYRCW